MPDPRRQLWTTSGVPKTITNASETLQKVGTSPDQNEIPQSSLRLELMMLLPPEFGECGQYNYLWQCTSTTTVM